LFGRLAFNQLFLGGLQSKQHPLTRLIVFLVRTKWQESLPQDNVDLDVLSGARVHYGQAHSIFGSKPLAVLCGADGVSGLEAVLIGQIIQM
jgi:hypothetical protein